MVTLGIIISKIGIYFKSIKLLILGIAQKIPYLIAIIFVYINIYIKKFKTCVDDSIFNPDCISSLKTLSIAILILIICGFFVYLGFKYFNFKKIEDK